MILLITGGAGFIGSNFVKLILKKKMVKKIIVLDLLTYAGNLNNLKKINSKKYIFIKGDIKNKNLLYSIFYNYKINLIINFAAETHVDRSIKLPNIFFKTNILGTQTLLNTALKFWNLSKLPLNKFKFIQISTDEVYGSAKKNEFFKECSKLNPTNPYASSKAAADLIALSYYKTYGLPVIITRSSNNYGKNQMNEKLIPLTIYNCINNIKIPIFGDGSNKRNWIHVFDHCKAIIEIIEKGKIGEIYNICDNKNEKTNIEIVKIIISIFKKSEKLIEYTKDRLGHDKRYAMNSFKIIETLKWKPKYIFEKEIKKIINWKIINK